MPRKRKAPLSRAEQVEEWKKGTWRVSPRGARWRNIKGYNVAVMEIDGKSGVWKWRLKRTEDDDAAAEWKEPFTSEHKAKTSVLNKLADKLGLV
jgi:hypothetical protein